MKQQPKITEQHLREKAYVYVRQSTLSQVMHHQESTNRQYALKDKALHLGWKPKGSVFNRVTGGLRCPGQDFIDRTWSATDHRLTQ